MLPSLMHISEDFAMTVRRSDAEVARRGDEIYERDIRTQIESDHHGEFVAIDVDSGCWGISADLLEARAQLDRERIDLDAHSVWFVRVGFPTLRSFGGRPTPPAT